VIWGEELVVSDEAIMIGKGRFCGPGKLSGWGLAVQFMIGIEAGEEFEGGIGRGKEHEDEE